MTPRALRALMALALTALTLASLTPLQVLAPVLLAQTQPTSLPRLVLVNLWKVSHASYMAKFMGEDYVVVFDTHGDVSLDGKYISTAGNAWVYKTSTGQLLAQLTGGGTWRVDSWEPFSAVKVWSNGGFFSGDSKRMIEDPRFYGGTNARVLDTGTWTPIPVDWGFTDTNGNNFYAVQLDYNGLTLAVGHISDGTLLVYRYDPVQGKYTLVLKQTESGNYGRRLHTTLDGKYIVVGGLSYGYVDIWEWNGSGYTRIVHYQLPDTGGAGALGISDPWRVGYVIIGTQNGWGIIGYFNSSTREYKTVYQLKFAPDGSWVYNPFYERWIPKTTEVFALASKAGYGLVYDVLTNTSTVINYGTSSVQWTAAAVSPEARYIYLGNTLYMVVKRDVESGVPRIRFWGSMTSQHSYQPLSTPLILAAPARDWSLYYYSGRLTIQRVYVEPVPVDLVEDKEIVEGRLARMHARGLVSKTTLYTSNAEIRELEVIPGYSIADILRDNGVSSFDNFIATVESVKFTPPPYFWEGEAWTGTVVHVPLDKPVYLYDSIELAESLSIHSSTLLYDKNKRALGLIGVPVEIGGGIGVGATAYSKIANSVLRWYVTRHGVVENLGKISAVTTTTTAAKVAGVVGLVVAAWGAIDAVLVEWGGFGDINVQSWIAIAPTVVDQYGNKYTALHLVLPLEESGRIQAYYDRLTSYFKSLGYRDVGFRVDYPCRTWDEYKILISQGYAPRVDLYNLIKETIASKYSLDVNTLRITGVDTAVITAVKAKETFWEWLFTLGGVDADAVTLIGASLIQVKGRLKPMVTSDPTAIADILRVVYVNGMPFQLTPGKEGAYADFSFPLGASTLIVDFGGQRVGYYADVNLKLRVLVEKPFQPLNGYGYTVTLHYDWENTAILVDQIEFADMPQPMLKAERIFIYAYGNFTNDITEAFELKQSVNDTRSPTGVFYWYITRNNTKFLDPANGAVMQPCKTYVFNYYYSQPPDAGIIVYLNGTRVTSTLPQHAVVVVNSTVEQDVSFTLRVSVKYLKEGVVTAETILGEEYNGTLHVQANSSSYTVYNILPFVDAAIEFMRSMNKTAYVEVYAKITEAKYNYYKANDEYTVIYYPPPTIPPPLPGPGPYNVTVRVYEADFMTWKWRPAKNARVEVYYGEAGVSPLLYVNTTNENGETWFLLPAGTWRFVAVSGRFPQYYRESVVVVPVYNDTVVNMYLAPRAMYLLVNTSIAIDPGRVELYIYDALSYKVVYSATASATLVEPVESPFYGRTETSPVHTAYNKAILPLHFGRHNVTVTAPGYNTFTTIILVDKGLTVVNVPLTPAGVDLSLYAKLDVRAYYIDYNDSIPFREAVVEVSNSTHTFTLKTDSNGVAVFLLEKGKQYTVTVKASEPRYNLSYTETRTVNLTGDTTLVYAIPWNGLPPTIEGFYWLTIETLWQNGLSFSGAVVSIYTYPDRVFIDSLRTSTLGASFLLPAFKEYLVKIEAVNPYNSSDVFYHAFILNLSTNKLMMIPTPWYPQSPPEPPGVTQKYRVVVYAYDATNGRGVSGVTVVASKGSMVWGNITNATGYTELYLPFLGLYNFTAFHESYQAVYRLVELVENNTLVTIPLSPGYFNLTLPLNGTYPPVYINGTPYYWLSIQVIYRDGYPFHGANVTVVDLSTNTTIASLVTNGTGFAHFLIQAGKQVKYTVNASNPLNSTEVYTAERTLNMTQHYYFIHTVPWTSGFFKPEVWMVSVNLVVHWGLGYLYGNVSHLVLLSIWTNTPQNITVQVELYNETLGALYKVSNTTLNLTLAEGVNVFFTWLPVNASQGGWFRAFANITSWQNDTDTSNNYAWSPPVYLKPFMDIQVIVTWRMVEQKQEWSILPEDILEVDVAVKIPANTTEVPAILEWGILAYDLTSRNLTLVKAGMEEIRVVEPGVVWRNMTLRVPWTPRLVVYANASHPWEVYALNNYVNVTIPVDPDVKLAVIEKPGVVMEKSVFKVKVNLTSNVEGGKIGWVSLVDNTTATVLRWMEVEIKPNVTLELDAKAPENPSAVWVIRKPATQHVVEARFTGYDVYTLNNAEEMTITVLSWQWAIILIGIVVLIAVVAAVKAASHTALKLRESSRRFVKKHQAFETSEEGRFVKKKK